MKKLIVLFAIVALIPATSVMAQSIITTHIATPDQVPDESLPRGNFGDAPAGFGPNSWQGPETGKSNWHARYLADGNYLSAIFPDEAATLTIGDLASISYFTKRPDGTPATRDWWIQIYTRPTNSGDQASWYHDRFINNYGDHTNTGDWVQYSTDSGMTFHSNGLGTIGVSTLADLQDEAGDQLIEMISVQTDSGWNGYDGYLDGLQIVLTDGSVGVVNFEAVPEPASLAVWGAFGVLGLCGVMGRRRKR